MQQAMDMHKNELGKGPWCAASFPVPKKWPGEFRLVVDEGEVNTETLKDGYALPLISEILQKQGKYKM